jgi:uncharacterized membrane protein required for colicin V production
MTITGYDAAMIGVVVAGMVWGALRGVTWQVASLASLVLGYAAAHPLSGLIAPSLPGEPVVARTLAMVVAYLGVSGGIFFAAWLVRATLRRLRFEAFDRHLGMLLGGVEGALIGVVVTLFVVSLAPQTRGPIFASPSGKVVGRLMAAVGPVLPDEARGVLAPFWSDPGRGAGDEAPLARTAARPKADAGVAPASLRDLVDREEKRLGKAIADEAARGLKQATAGGADDADAAVERR